MSVVTMSTSEPSVVLRPEGKDKCLFDIYKKEGDEFYVRRKYKKAMDSYSLVRILSHSSLCVNLCCLVLWVGLWVFLSTCRLF